MMRSTERFEVDKVTKGAVRYAPTEDSDLGVIYIRKDHFGNEAWPNAIMVTIEEVK